MLTYLTTHFGDQAQQIEANLVLHLDVKDGSTVLNPSFLPASNSEKVARCLDKSGLGNDGNQTVNTSRPTFLTAGLPSTPNNPTLNTASTAQELNLPDNSLFTSLTNFTVICVFSKNTLSGFDTLLGLGDEIGDRPFIGFRNTRMNFGATGASPVTIDSSTNLIAGTPYVGVWREEAGAGTSGIASFFLNGIADGGGVFASGMQFAMGAPRVLMGQQSGVAERFGGRLSEIKVYDTNLKDDLCISRSKTLKTKWGI